MWYSVTSAMTWCHWRSRVCVCYSGKRPTIEWMVDFILSVDFQKKNTVLWYSISQDTCFKICSVRNKIWNDRSISFGLSRSRALVIVLSICYMYSLPICTVLIKDSQTARNVNDSFTLIHRTYATVVTCGRGCLLLRTHGSISFWTCGCSIVKTSFPQRIVMLYELWTSLGTFDLQGDP